MVRVQILRRLLLVASLLAGVLFVGAGVVPDVVAGPRTQQTGIDFEWRLQGTPPAIVLPPSSETTVVISGFVLRNNAPITNTYRLQVTSLPNGWRSELSTARVTLSPSTISPGNTQSNISVRLTIPAGAQTGNQSITVTAFKLDTNDQAVAQADVFVPLTLVVGSPVPTAALPPGCPEANDPGNNFEGARLVRVDLEEAHGICTTGDEDWYKFAAVGGKLYTIDVPQMDVGLDLSLELYDEQRNLLATNDDFFNRTPGTPIPSDKRPRIQSWRSPRDGTYVVRVRDTLGVGGRDLGYTFVVRGESFGPTPTTVVELCNDPFEPDGLPELAKLIFSNETQPQRVMCPEGDADWVRFFAIAGRLYIIYTDTRPYAAKPDDPLNYPEPGADTVLFLADRDGQRILDANNDLPFGNSLDSEIQFRPVVDGFYYVQVKNIGDIGSQFIKYDLTVRACPGEYCRVNRPGSPPPATFEVPTPTAGT